MGSKQVVVLVGGAGYLGVSTVLRSVEKKLVGEELSFFVAARRRSVKRRRWAREILKRAGTSLILGETIEPSMIEGVSPDVVVYMAGKPGGERGKVWEAHYGLLKRLFNAIGSVGARLVYVSSIAVRADLSRDPPGSIVYEEEEHLSGEGRFETYHSESKAEGERLTASYRGRWAILRPGLILGWMNPHLEWKLLKMACRLHLVPHSPYAPVVRWWKAADAILKAVEGELDGRWVHVVEERGMREVLQEECGLSRSLAVNVHPLAGIGRLAGRGSPLRLGWSILRKKHYYRSRFLTL